MCIRDRSYRYRMSVKPRDDSVVGEDGGPPPARPVAPRRASLRVVAPRSRMACCDTISTEAGVSRRVRPSREALLLRLSRCRLSASLEMCIRDRSMSAGRRKCGEWYRPGLGLSLIHIFN